MRWSAPYPVILSDPPWTYYGSPTKMGAAGKEYALMEDEDLRSLDVALADPGVLFLWATCPRLDFALECIRSWGLHYRGVAFVWVKTKADGITPIGAQGVRLTIVKPTTEFVLAASTRAKGRPLPLASESVRQVVLAPKREHSRKPDEVARRIDALYPHARKLEMFARERRPGWDAWGDDSDHVFA